MLTTSLWLFLYINIEYETHTEKYNFNSPNYAGSNGLIFVCFVWLVYANVVVGMYNILFASLLTVVNTQVVIMFVDIYIYTLQITNYCNYIKLLSDKHLF